MLYQLSYDPLQRTTKTKGNRGRLVEPVHASSATPALAPDSAASYTGVHRLVLAAPERDTALGPASGVDPGGAEQEHHHRRAQDAHIGGLRR